MSDSTSPSPTSDPAHPPAASPHPISTPDQLTPAWLTDVLRSAGEIHRAQVTAVRSEPIGHGLVGDSFRIHVTYDEADDVAPRTLVGKFPAADAESREAAVQHRHYLRETRFYQQVAATVDIRTPHCVCADIDPRDPGSFLLLFEDLAPCRQGDQLAGCTPDQAALVMEQAAALHASRWGDRALGRLEWLPDVAANGAAIQPVLPPLFEGFCARYGDQLEPEHLAVGEQVVAGLAAYLGAGRPEQWTIQHADFRLDNMLFDAHDGKLPFVAMDWQTVLRGEGTHDVAYFLGAGLQTEDRRMHERDLVREYHRALLARGVEGFDWDECWRQYRLFAYAGYLMAFAASMLVERTERGDRMFMTMARRHAAHVLDLSSHELLA
jgi:hypothetical protein